MFYVVSIPNKNKERIGNVEGREPNHSVFERRTSATTERPTEREHGTERTTLYLAGGGGQQL